MSTPSLARKKPAAWRNMWGWASTSAGFPPSLSDDVGQGVSGQGATALGDENIWAVAVLAQCPQVPHLVSIQRMKAVLRVLDASDVDGPVVEVNLRPAETASLGSPEAVAIYEAQERLVAEPVATPFGRRCDKLVGLIGSKISAGLADFRLFADRDRSLHSSNPLIWHPLCRTDHTTVSVKGAKCRKLKGQFYVMAHPVKIDDRLAVPERTLSHRKAQSLSIVQQSQLGSLEMTVSKCRRQYRWHAQKR